MRDFKKTISCNKKLGVLFKYLCLNEVVNVE